MITKSIIKAAEKAMPIEEKLQCKLERFFGKNATRLIVSGITALVFTGLIYEIVMHSYNGRFAVLLAIMGLIDLTAIGAFFANIEKFSMKVFGISVGIASVLLYISTTVFSILSGLDLTAPDLLDIIYSAIPNCVLIGIAECGVSTALVILTAKLVVGRKKQA